MGILDNVERGLERAVNGAFAKTFRSGLAPIELSSALRKEMDTNVAIVTRDRVLAPNDFTLHVSETDHEKLATMSDVLVDELVEFAEHHAAEQHYQFVGDVTVDIRADSSLAQGMLSVTSRSTKTRRPRTAALDVDGSTRRLATGTIVIGRGREADLTIDDTGASRKHAAISWDGQRATVRDLGSTNGTKLNGQRVTEAALTSGDVVSIGRVRVTFRLGDSGHDAFWGQR